MKRQWRRFFAPAAVLLLVAALLCGCGAPETPGDPDDVLATTAPLSDEVAQTDPDSVGDAEEEDLQIDTFVILNDDATAINGEGASFQSGRLTIFKAGVYSVKGTLFQSGRLTIFKAGVYSVKGTLTDGQICVDTDDNAKVKLYLDGVKIYCADSAPLYVAQAKKETQIILAKGSENRLSDNAGRTMTEAQANDNDFATAVIYSKDDLQIGGEGALTVEANFNKGIFSRDDLRLKGGALTITAKDDGIRGKDSVEISGGTVKIKCGGDGIRTSNENKGDLSVSGGDITVESTGDCLQAVGNIAVSGGSFRLQSGGGYRESLQTQKRGGGFFGGVQTGKTEGDTVSAKGIKADAVHADETVAVSGGEWIIEASYEGLEGRQVAVSGGALDVTAQDDGVNAAAPGDQNDMALFAGAPDGMEPPTDDSGRPQPPAGEPPQNGQQPGEAPADGFGFWRQGGGKGGPDQADESCAVLISGGVLKVNAAGDGIDSNGSIAVSGGTVLVFGPTNDGNGALDYAGSCTVTGGSLCAFGAAGMAQGASDGTSGRLEARLTLAAGDTLTVQDESGGEVYAVRLEKPAAHLALAGNMLQRGRTYTLLVNGSEAAAAKAE